MFQYAEEAPAANGCGVTFMGEFWYFGSVNKVSLNYFLSSKYMISLTAGLGK